MSLKNFNTIFFFAVLITVSVGAFLLFAPFLSAIFVAALLAVVFARPYEAVANRLGGYRGITSFIMCCAIAIVIILPLVGIGGAVGAEVSSAVERISAENSAQRQTVKTIVDNTLSSPLGKIVAQHVASANADEALASVIKNIGNKVGPALTKTYQGIIGSVVWIFVMFFTLFYFFIDGKRFVRKLMKLSPLKDTHEEMLIARFVSMTRATLKGTFIVGLGQGFIGGVAFLIAGVSSPMIWTVLMIFLSIIPAVGPALVLVPAGIVMMLLGSVWQGILLLVTAAIVSSADNLVRPKLVGSDTQMPSVLIFFATIGGLSVFGLIGFIVGPIIMALAIAMWEIYAVEFREQLKEYNA